MGRDKGMPTVTVEGVEGMRTLAGQLRGEVDRVRWGVVSHALPGLESELGELTGRIVSALEEARSLGDDRAVGRLTLKLEFRPRADGLLSVSYDAAVKHPVQREPGVIVGAVNGTVRPYEELPEVAEARRAQG